LWHRFRRRMPPCKARSPISPPSEPALLVIGAPFARLGSRLGPHPVLDAVGRCIPLVGGGGAAALPCEQAGRPREDAPRRLPAGRPWGRLSRRALHHGVPPDTAARACVPPAPTPNCQGAGPAARGGGVRSAAPPGARRSRPLARRPPGGPGGASGSAPGRPTGGGRPWWPPVPCPGRWPGRLQGEVF
jgi:hypothetical protein